MTVLYAFSESPERGARKLPAAPTNKMGGQVSLVLRRIWYGLLGLTANHKINPSKLLDSLPYRLLELIRLPHVRLSGDTRVPRTL